MKLGIARREAERVEREYRERDLERLEAQTVTGDLHAGVRAQFRRRSASAGRGRGPGLGLRRAAVRCSSSASTIYSTTSLCAPSPLVT